VHSTPARLLTDSVAAFSSTRGGGALERPGSLQHGWWQGQLRAHGSEIEAVRTLARVQCMKGAEA
jgi:hypothetical protein